MSTKTIYKRIALVAVAALGAGVLSVAPATAADNAAAGAANATTAASVLNIATAPSITGAAVTSTTFADQRSLGLLANSTTMGNGLTQTATLSSTGAIVVYLTGVTDGASTISVTGGTISAHTGDKTINVNSTKTQLVTVDDSAALKISAAITPNAGATTMRIEYHQAAAVTAVDDGSTEAAVAASIQAGATSRGTLTGAISVTVATTSLSGVYSAADSSIQGVTDDTATASSNVDVTDSLKIQNVASAVAYIAINLEDAYGVSLTNKGALVVSGTNGAGIFYDGGSAAGVPTNFTAVGTDTTGTITVARPAAFANKAFSTTVTISWNGAVVGTKTVTFLGEVATVTASSPKIGALGVANTSAFRLAYADSAGNALYPTITDTSAVSSTLTTVVTGLAVGLIGSSSALAEGTLTCGADAGSADVQVQHINPLSGTVVKSNVWKATCAGDAATYTASWDKASYTPGSIATLSILFKDEDGNLANAYTEVSGASADLITITGGPSATAVTIPADGDTATNGVKTYQFVVGTTEGDFSAVVSAPLVNAVDGVNQTVSYKVANAVGAVSNADVLKAIVSLIASINKQIAALQKALLKKK